MAKHRGRGVATINYPIGMNLGGDPSQALVHSNPTGKFTVALSSIDLGQGMKSVTRQICAETLGVPVADVYVEKLMGVIPANIEHEGFFPEDSELVDVFAPPREDFLAGGMPSYMYEA